jgi:hypothetical protein
MSFDINLQTVCNHKIYKELVALDADGVSIRPLKPIAAAGSVILYASEDIVPNTSYSIVADPLTVDVYRPKMILLNKKWQEIEDYFEVTYVTMVNFCPKCVGRSIIDDISYDVKGDLFAIRNEKLLLQNLEKFTVTEIGSNPFHGYIGTALVTLLGQKISDPNFTANKMIGDINNSLSKFKDMQDQYRLTGRVVSTGELLEAIESINVTVDPVDPTIMNANITAKAQSGRSIGFTQVLQIA